MMYDHTFNAQDNKEFAIQQAKEAANSINMNAYIHITKTGRFLVNSQIYHNGIPAYHHVSPNIKSSIQLAMQEAKEVSNIMNVNAYIHIVKEKRFLVNSQIYHNGILAYCHVSPNFVVHWYNNSIHNYN